MNHKEDELGFIPEETVVEGNKPGLPAQRSVSIRIPEETLKQITDMVGDQPLWVKATTFGFSHGDTVTSEIRGIIIDAEPYLVKFEGNKAIKLPHEADAKDIPAGFERRCDIKVDTGGGQIIGVSLAKSSFLKEFAPYVNHLMHHGLEPSDVVTVMRTRVVNNQYGTFAVVDFKLADEVTSEKKILDETRITESNPPKAANNPWA